MQTRILDILTNEQLLRLSGACGEDGRPLAHQVFFEPEAWEISPDYEPMIVRHAVYLIRRPELVAVLSGHSTGTGSQRYFWLMGDRRAHAVRRMLVRAGVPGHQIKVQSAGEARPSIESGGPELARWRRRVSIEYVAGDAEALRNIPEPGSPHWWRSVLGAHAPRLPGPPPASAAASPRFYATQSSSAASSPGNSTSV